MLTTLFFLLLIFPLYSEMSDILTPGNRREFLRKLNNHKNLTEPEKKKEAKGIIGEVAFLFLYLALIIVGMLMSSQWILFLILFLIGFVIGFIKRLSKNIIYQNIIIITDAIACSFIILYIIINHFHHLDLFPLDLKGFLGMFGVNI